MPLLSTSPGVRRPVLLAAVALFIGISGPVRAQTVYVDASNLPGPGSGTPTDPFVLIQDGLDAASNTGTVSVAAGTYSEALILRADRNLIGAGAATTIIDGTGTGEPCIKTNVTGGVVAGSVIQGFTIRNASTAQGGGIRATNDCTIRDCVITGNSASVQGGGIFASSSGSVVVEGCTISNNTALQSGGGVWSSISLSMNDCVLADNGAGAVGGNNLFAAGTPVLSDCQFTGSTGGRASVYFVSANAVMSGCAVSGSQGGGVVIDGASDLTMTRCVVSDNSSCCKESGVRFHNGSTGTVENCTITGNVSPSAEAGVVLGTSCVVTVTNSILWNNSLGEILVDPTAALTVTFSDVQGGFAGTGNIDLDPQFNNAASGDFTLLCTSPAIDAGDPSPAFDDPDGSRNDMGAFPATCDSDGDGLDDAEEIAIGTNPFDADSDDDGLDDGMEVDLAGFGACPNPLVADSDGDGLSDGAEILTNNTDPCDADSDADGLADGIEVALGTGPLDPDSDDDGLLDGTEVDVAGGTGCPDPLVADSDGDTLSDGDEALVIGTDPCSADTDGDGVSDDVDPLPTTAGVTNDFIVDGLRATCDEVALYPLGVIAAPNNNARRGRLNAICNKLSAAAKSVEAGDYQKAHDQLTSLFAKLDGEPSPADWMIASAEKADLASDVALMVVLIEYEL